MTGKSCLLPPGLGLPRKSDRHKYLQQLLFIMAGPKIRFILYEKQGVSE